MKTLIQNSINALETEYKTAVKREEAAAAAVASDSAQSASADTSDPFSYAVSSFVGITQYAWDQTAKSISIYISLKGVGSIDREHIACRFSSDSVDLRVVKLNGRNQRLNLTDLYKDIDESGCKYRVKADKIVLTLKKSAEGQYTWPQLCDKKKQKKSQSKDPSAGLMDMMRDLYNEGDETMKVACDLMHKHTKLSLIYCDVVSRRPLQKLGRRANRNDSVVDCNTAYLNKKYIYLKRSNWVLHSQ